MPRLVIDPVKQDQITTSELYNDDITDRRITFGADGVSEQDLDDDVAEQFVEAYDALELESNVDDEQIDELAELLAGTVDDVRDALESGEYDDELDALEQREREGDERTTVFDAIEQRRRRELDQDSADPDDQEPEAADRGGEGDQGGA